MTTIAPGQQIHQIINGRIWRITQPVPVDRYTRQRRWQIELLGQATRGFEDRNIGDPCTVSEEWLQSACEDHPHRIPPPCGDSPQTARIYLADGELYATGIFNRARDVIVWIEQNLDPDRVCWWYGWDAPDTAEPDLTCRLETGTLLTPELVWSEPAS